MTLEKHLVQRRKQIEERIAEEMLSGNEVKLNQERAALAELDGIEKKIREEKYYKISTDETSNTFDAHGISVSAALVSIIQHLVIETIKTHKGGKK